MKKILFAGIAASALFVGPALAADMAVKAPRVAPPPAPVTSWTGCYINGGFGYGMWNQDNNEEDQPSNVASSIVHTDGGRGWLGTVGAGCDYQFNQNIVIGALGDFDFSDIKGTLTDGTWQGDESQKWAWAVGARIGWLVTPNLLTYVNGGYTQAHFNQINIVSEFSGAPVGDYLAAHTYSGWFIGGGTEYNIGFMPGLFWRSEYRYASYQAADLPFLLTSTGQPDCGEGCFGMHSKKFVQTIRSELVYRFGWH